MIVLGMSLGGFSLAVRQNKDSLRLKMISLKSKQYWLNRHFRQWSDQALVIWTKNKETLFCFTELFYQAPQIELFNLIWADFYLQTEKLHHCFIRFINPILTVYEGKTAKY